MRQIIITILLMVAISTAAMAQVSVSVRLQDEIYAGEMFRMDVVATNGKTQPEINPAELAKFNPDFLGSTVGQSSSRIVINGRVVEDKTEYSSSWALMVEQPGEYTIPSLTVKVDGKEYKSEPVDFTAITPQTADFVGLEAKLSTNECYLGQPLALTVKWYAPLQSVARGGFNFSIPDIMDESQYSVSNSSDSESGGNVQTIQGSSIGDIVANIGKGTYKGRQLDVVEFTKLLMPKQTGELVIDPISVVCKIATGTTRGDSPFDNPFFGQTTYTRFQANAEPIKLMVRPLPDEGKPAGFYGLVGTRFFIRSELVNPPAEISVGTPLTIRIIISGNNGFLQNVKMPNLTFMAGDFKIPPDQASPQQTKDGLIFTQTIRPMRSSEDGLVGIPSIALPYFNYQLKEYQVAKTEPIKIDVASARIIEQADASGAVANTGSVGSELTKAQPRIAANHYGDEVLVNRAFSLRDGLLSIWSLAAMLGPALLVLVSLYISVTSVKDPEKIRARTAAAALARAVKLAGELPDKNSEKYTTMLTEILRGYIADKFSLTAQSLTAADCRASLIAAGVSLDRVDEFCRIVECGEHSRYAGSFKLAVELPDRKGVVLLLRTVDGEVKGGKR